MAICVHRVHVLPSPPATLLSSCLNTDITDAHTPRYAYSMLSSAALIPSKMT